MEIKLNAMAKINLMLDILGRLDNGYHSLWMIMQSVNLFDTVCLADTQGAEIKVTCSDKRIPTNEENLAYKAAQAFIDTMGITGRGVKIDITKRIPLAAGLAGGSANAAAVILGMNELFNTKLTTLQLNKIGLSVGADVPFCMYGGTMLAQDIGGVLAPLPDLPDCYIVLAKPEKGISTAKAYQLFDEEDNYRRPDKCRMLRAAVNEDLPQMAKLVANVFEQVIEVPERVNIKTIMRENGAIGCCMSGSGPTVFGLFDDEQSANRCADELKSIVSSVFVCKPANKGVVRL